MTCHKENKRGGWCRVCGGSAGAGGSQSPFQASGTKGSSAKSWIFCSRKQRFYCQELKSSRFSGCISAQNFAIHSMLPRFMGIQHLIDLPELES